MGIFDLFKPKPVEMWKKNIDVINDLYDKMGDKTYEVLLLYSKNWVTDLLNALKYKDIFIAGRAAEALGKIGGQIGDDRAYEALIHALRHKSDIVAGYAAKGLGKMGDKRAVEPLLQAWKDNRVPKAELAQALGEMGDKRAVEPLVQALKNRSWEVRAAAAEALGKMGDEGAFDPLLRALKEEKQNYHVISNASYALAKIGGPKAIVPLTGFLQNKGDDIAIIRNLVPSFRIIGKPAVEYLARDMGRNSITEKQITEKRQERIVKTFILMGELAVETLISNLNHKDTEVRIHAAKALNKIEGRTHTFGEPETVTKIRNLIKRYRTKGRGIS